MEYREVISRCNAICINCSRSGSISDLYAVQISFDRLLDEVEIEVMESSEYNLCVKMLRFTNNYLDFTLRELKEVEDVRNDIEQILKNN